MNTIAFFLTRNHPINFLLCAKRNGKISEKLQEHITWRTHVGKTGLVMEKLNTGTRK